MAKKTAKWVCQECVEKFGGPRSLGEHYRVKPSHGAKSTHRNTRLLYEKILANKKADNSSDKPTRTIAKARVIEPNELPTIKMPAGTPVFRFCTQCGKSARPGWRFCGHCGQKRIAD